MTLDKRHPDYIDLRSRIRENPKDFVVIVGAGMSRPCGLPTWTNLRGHLVDNARNRISEIPELERQGHKERLNRIAENTDLWRCFTELQGILSKEAYEEAIRERLTLKDKSSIPVTYELLWQLDVKGIMTYNIDTCAVDSYSKVHRSAVDTATAKETAKFSRFLIGPQQFVFQPHGHVSDPSTWVFTQAELGGLLASSTYTKFVQSLCQTKHLLIVGFDPDDFAFSYLLQKVVTEPGTIGSRHYLLLSRTDSGIVNTYGNQGFAVIPYRPSDPNSHPEIEETLRDFLKFLPEDDIPASVFTGGQTDLGSLPSDADLLTMPVHHVRELLNKAVASIIPPNTTPKTNDIDMLEKFYADHLRAIHMAWLIQPNSECDVVHGYKMVAGKGRGAFGQVYEAEKLDTGERAALKVLLQEVRSDSEYLNSFRRGVRSMKILTQKNVPKMVKFINAFEVPACVLMEFIDGPTLTEAKNWGLLDSLQQTLDVLVQIGDVVHTAHDLEERVLHRDLKPDNVILRDGYNKGDPIDVVVLDFDLSWHKGASDLSVVHGARAQGYAAPEQTATGMKAGVSTRHTAVDTFGYGMLAYFLFVGDDPRPNEQNFHKFKEHVRDSIRTRFSCNWRCLPSYLARTVEGCTRDKQQSRLPFTSAIEAFREAYRMTFSDQVSSSNPLVLEEMAVCLESDGSIDSHDFGREVHVHGIDPSKRIKLKLHNEGDTIVVHIELTKIRSEWDHRNVAKYLPTAKTKALSKLNVATLKNVDGTIGLSLLTVTAQWPLKTQVSRKEIEDVCARLLDARNAMDLG
ncbi:MAG: SIR2 family protein [Thermodesulfobacteriota bacterium]